MSQSPPHLVIERHDRAKKRALGWCLLISGLPLGCRAYIFQSNPRESDGILGYGQKIELEQPLPTQFADSTGVVYACLWCTTST